MQAAATINDFSKHLFWDTDRATLDFQLHKEQIVYQVLTFGLLHDWKLLLRIYPEDQIK